MFPVEECKNGKRFWDGNLSIYMGLTLMALVFAGTPYFVRIAINNAPTMSIVFMRFLFAALLQFPFVVRQERRLWLPAKEDLPWVLTLGILGMLLFHYLFFAATLYTSPVNIAVITSMMPISASVIAALQGKENMTGARICAMLITFVGVLFVLSGGDMAVIRSMKFNRGDLMMLVGTVFFAWYNVGSKSVLAKYSPISSSFFFTVVTVIFSFPFFLREAGGINWSAPSVWIAMIYMGFFPSGIGLYIQQLGIQRIGISRAVGFNNLVPVFSVVISLIVIGSRSVSFAQLVGMVLIIAGVFWNSRIR